MSTLPDPRSHTHDPPPHGPEREAVEAELTRCFHDIFHTWTQRGGGVLEQLRESFSPEFSGFGTGRQERYPDRSTLLDSIRQEMEEVPHPFALRYAWTEARLMAPTVGLADAEAAVTMTVGDGETVSFDLRISAVLRLEGDEWRLAYSHVSMPASEQAGDETWPIDALRARNEELERLVAERTADLRAAQAQLVHQEKMASLGALTAGIAHEIKNPLNFVTNFAALSRELLADLAAEADPEERAAILADLDANAGKIAEHGARADAIVSAMMQHAQGGAGERQTVDLNGLVREYAGHARHARLARDPDADVALDLRLGGDVGTVEAVPQEIGRAVVALLSNAFDAVRQRPGAGRVTVSTERRGGHAVVRVEDDGPGIAPGALGRVFEPFYTTKPTGQGHTGLGLSLAHDAVVQGHGGALTAENRQVGDASEPGHGAVFTLTLPIS